MPRRRRKTQRPRQLPWSKTTGWHNNCGLNCLTHFLAAKLESGELQENVASEPSYFSLLNAFQTYYGLKTQPSWQDIAELLKKYPTPTDHEAILGPVLRLELGKVLKKHAETLWDTEGSAAISAYLFTGELSDIALPIKAANPEWFAFMKENYEYSLEAIQQEAFSVNERKRAIEALQAKIPPREKTEENIQDQILFWRKDDLNTKIQDSLKKYWLEEGCERYALHMADLKTSEMVSADQLSLLAQELKIALEVVTPRGIRTKMGHDAPLWEFNVYNGGAHWEFKNPDPNPGIARAKTSEHNRFYPKALRASAIVNDTSLSGQFKIHLGGEENLDNYIIACVQSAMTTPKGSHELAFRQPTSLLIQAPSAIRKSTLQDRSVDHGLQVKAEKAMNYLVDNLERWEKRKQISSNDQLQIFQSYFEFIHRQYTSTHPDEAGLRRVIEMLNTGKLNKIKEGAKKLAKEPQENVQRSVKRSRSPLSHENPSKHKKVRKRT